MENLYILSYDFTICETIFKLWLSYSLRFFDSKTYGEYTTSNDTVSRSD